jgi:feruloyl esterase
MLLGSGLYRPRPRHARAWLAWGTGNDNIGGSIVYQRLGGVLRVTAQAVANTDLGTSRAATQGAGVLIGHPEKQIDYATRSTHLMTVRAKEIIKAFYGEPPARSYFYGCSTGGRQGVDEARSFPVIIMGSPPAHRQPT